MNDKLLEAAQYLRFCNIIENNAFKLYETLSKKTNQPESSFVLGLAYDSLKNATIIQSLLDYFDLPELENINVKKNLAELVSETAILSKRISKINNLNYIISCETLKELTNLEELLGQIYTSYLKSSFSSTIADELARLVTMNRGNLKKLFETFIEEKAKHRETLVEIIYSLEAQQAETIRQITPMVKYKNPDAWIHESTIHAFSNTIANAET
jgi:hypothetical protein